MSLLELLFLGRTSPLGDVPREELPQIVVLNFDDPVNGELTKLRKLRST